jgi:hypothetical protein
MPCFRTASGSDRIIFHFPFFISHWSSQESSFVVAGKSQFAFGVSGDDINGKMKNGK